MIGILLGFLVIWMFIKTVEALRTGRELVTPGVRPRLATMICLWEFLSPLTWLHSHYLSQHPLLVRPGHIVPHPVYPLGIGFSLFGCALAVAAGLALWRMMRLAYPLFVLQFGLSLLSFIVLQIRHLMPVPPRVSVRVVVYIIEVVGIGVNAAVVWYVRDITRPHGAFPTEMPAADL